MVGRELKWYQNTISSFTIPVLDMWLLGDQVCSKRESIDNLCFMGIAVCDICH